ncbi:MAG: hypothetical protein SFY69_03140 [Planctomycetota bacterium]|nr:hypothetical protein [Planctomycetota bacterium]
MTWMHRVRRRALWIVVGVGVTALGVIAMSTIPVWPVLGVAVATLAIALGSITRSVSPNTCLGCGHNLAGTPAGEHGRICPTCGSLNERLVGDLTAESDRA